MARVERTGRRKVALRALHFVLLGTALFLGERWLVERGEPTGGEPMATVASTSTPLRVVTVTAARREQLRHGWLRTTGRPPTAGEEEWLIRQWAEEEILYREALRLGLDRDNPGVCHRLALNLQFLEMPALETPAPAADREELCRRARELGLDRDDPVIRRQLAELTRLLLRGSADPETSREKPSRAELEAYVERHRDRFSEPARVRLSHVFLARGKRGSALDADARRLHARLTAEGTDPDAAVALGDPFLAGHHPPPGSRRDLEGRFGPAFADAVADLPAGRWTGPIPSAYGVHLVWIHERTPGRLRPFEQVAERAARGLAAERAEERLAAALEQLWQRWELRVEPAAEKTGRS